MTASLRAWAGTPLILMSTLNVNEAVVALESRIQRRQVREKGADPSGGALSTRSRSSLRPKRTMKSLGAWRITDIVASSMWNRARRWSRTMVGVTGGLVSPIKATKARESAFSAA